jgi:hypothetical protein
MSDDPERIRSFIAIELSEDLRSRLAALRNELERAEHSFVRWADPEGIHLTLKFLGNIPLRQVGEINGAMDGAVQGIPPFRLEISGLGGFPNLGQPRVLWIGIRGETQMLSRLQHRLCAHISRLRQGGTAICATSDPGSAQTGSISRGEKELRQPCQIGPLRGGLPDQRGGCQPHEKSTHPLRGHLHTPICHEAGTPEDPSTT